MIILNPKTVSFYVNLRVRDCSINPFGVGRAKRLERKARPLVTPKKQM